MSSLSSFMAQNALKVEKIHYVASKRFLDKDGKPISWEIGCVSSTEDEAIRRTATKRIPIPGKRGQFSEETDFNLYLGRLAAKCTIFPNLDDSDLQNSYGVMGDDVLLKTMLTPGEYADYLIEIQQINGFDTNFEEVIDEAKN